MSLQNPFNQKKDAILSEISSTQPDLSPKGTIDVLCLPIIELINSHNDMVTTSSCSGRISVFIEGTKNYHDETKVGGKGQGGRWLYVSHDSDNVLGWLDDLCGKGKLEFKTDITQENDRDFDGDTRYILYKYEPFILHVKCRDFEIASKLFNTAMACGFRESGIGSNNIVAIRINIKLDVPIGYLDEDSETLKMFVSSEYINLLNNLTLTKFKDNLKKMNQLHDKIDQEIIKPSTISVPSKSMKEETKEERRVRKIKEGLERQRNLKQTVNSEN